MSREKGLPRKPITSPKVPAGFPLLCSRRHPPYRIPEFLRMTPEESNAFLARFEQWIPVGVDNLRRRITSTPGFESWKPEATDTDFLKAGEWMGRNLSTTEYETVFENAKVRGLASNKVEFVVPEFRMTGLCISDEDSPVGVELGALFAHLLMRQSPDVRMRVETKASSWQENQPVLFVDRKKCRKTSICTPITLGINVAESFALKKSTPDQISEIWGMRIASIQRAMGPLQ